MSISMVQPIYLCCLQP
uniref:Uncharacterized protein n=1 Tax=Arundo donax TaxID=35708 RepID=A0A0A9HRF9_ARUDO